MGTKKTKTYCGYIAIIGRPSVGKSTLLNKILGEKISITARKPQTTRYRILGIKTNENAQAIYVDTPGLYRAKKASEKRTMNRFMMKTALSTISDVNAIIFMIDALDFRDDDLWILEKVQSANCPIILAINKSDQIKSKDEILLFIDNIPNKNVFREIIPLSAKTGFNIAALENAVAKLLPKNGFLFPKDDITDRNDRFLITEIIREKLIRFLGEELPYAVNVELEKYEKTGNLLTLHALIWVEKDSQKAIVIGAGGLKLKEIGTEARKDLERMLGEKIFLKLWVKVRTNWADDERILREFGY